MSLFKSLSKEKRKVESQMMQTLGTIILSHGCTHAEL